LLQGEMHPVMQLTGLGPFLPDRCT